jgi:hypothetical protein
VILNPKKAWEPAQPLRFSIAQGRGLSTRPFPVARTFRRRNSGGKFAGNGTLDEEPREQGACLDNHDAYVAHCRLQRPVAGHQRRSERLRQRQVSCVVSRDIVPQFPDARKQVRVWIALQRKVGKVQNSFDATCRGDGPRER